MNIQHMIINIMNLNQRELEEYCDMLQFRTDSPERMTDGDWDRWAKLREKRFEGE